MYRGPNSWINYSLDGPSLELVLDSTRHRAVFVTIPHILRSTQEHADVKPDRDAKIILVLLNLVPSENERS